MILFILLAFSLSITFMLGIRSFVNIWIGKENYILSYITVVFFTITLFLNIIYYPLLALINSNGLFKDNKNHIFICALINVVLSIILVIPFKINGILFATALAFLVNIFLKTKLVSNKVLNIKHIDLLKKYILLITIFILFSIGLFKVEEIILGFNLNIITCVLLLGIIFVFIAMITFIILYIIDKDTKNLFNRIKLIIKRK